VQTLADTNHSAELDPVDHVQPMKVMIHGMYRSVVKLARAGWLVAAGAVA
jgi:hypothetical protein